MTKKIRITRTMVIEYEPDPNYYPEGSTIEEMAQIDANTEGFETTFAEWDDEIVTWEIIDETE
ncbi:hypothetical protein [Metabacillus sp. Hm71]|uniref:hypothetical protein n=1 Tax=Metabacillus sp. Hm71 TaxID=3450743 RepID=UPI003F434446